MMRFASNDGRQPDFDPIPPSTAVAIRGQRVLGPDLRDRLVPAIGTGDRIFGRVPRRVAGNFYGWDVPGQPGSAAGDFEAPPSPAGLRAAGTGNRRVRDNDVAADAADRSPLHRR